MMILFKRITNPQDIVLSELLPLYKEAFPPEERRQEEQLRSLIGQKENMYFNALYQGADLAGLYIYWELEGFYYLEHLAVFESMRNLKIGQQVLDYIAENLQGLRLLEVEPAENEITRRRIAFYERNGYKILDKDYIQPSYDKEEDACTLWIMGNDTSEQLQEYIERIKREVYIENRFF